MQPFREHPARIATLEELFQRYDNLPMTIELKDRGEAGRRAGAALAALITKYNRASKVLIASFDDSTLHAFRAVAGPGVATSSSKEQTRSFVLLSLVRLDRWWRPSNPGEASGFHLARPGFIRAAHARNLAVHYWTVNDTNEMRRLIRLGADGIITDFPDRLKTILTEGQR